MLRPLLSSSAISASCMQDIFILCLDKLYLGVKAFYCGVLTWLTMTMRFHKMDMMSQTDA